MYSLHLTCQPAEVDRFSGELSEAGTIGLREIENGETTVLIAYFDSTEQRSELLTRFRHYSPEWNCEEQADWVRKTHDAWPARKIGEKLFLAPPWNSEPTPAGRKLLIHNPGLACGTGEHPCSQLALLALEKCVNESATVVDIGAGSGILAIAALRLGAASAIALDIDETALGAAKQNFDLNALAAILVAGSAECLAPQTADIVVANINATVLLSIFDDLLRITKAGGWLILTGFPKTEAGVFMKAFPNAQTFEHDEWRCLALRPSGA
jgi:ribosomal protein L11 methyltransferase